MTEPTETVDLVGVRANGEHVNLGKVAMPPRMKAREIAQSYFGPFQDDDGSESEACFVALEELIDWLVKQGWTPPQPTQAQAGAVPLTDEQWQRIADLTDSILTRATKDEIERVIGIKGDKHGL